MRQQNLSPRKKTMCARVRYLFLATRALASGNVPQRSAEAPTPSPLPLFGAGRIDPHTPGPVAPASHQPYQFPSTAKPPLCAGEDTPASCASTRRTRASEADDDEEAAFQTWVTRRTKTGSWPRGVASQTPTPSATLHEDRAEGTHGNNALQHQTNALQHCETNDEWSPATCGIVTPDQSPQSQRNALASMLSPCSMLCTESGKRMLQEQMPHKPTEDVASTDEGGLDFTASSSSHSTRTVPTPVRPPFLADHRSEDRRNLLRATTEQLALEQPQRNTSTQQAPSASPLPAPATGDAGGASGLCSQLREQLQEALTAYNEESDLHNRVRDSLQRQLCLRNLASEIRTALQSGQQWSPSGQCGGLPSLLAQTLRAPSLLPQTPLAPTLTGVEGVGVPLTQFQLDAISMACAAPTYATPAAFSPPPYFQQAAFSVVPGPPYAYAPLAPTPAPAAPGGGGAAPSYFYTRPDVRPPPPLGAPPAFAGTTLHDQQLAYGSGPPVAPTGGAAAAAAPAVGSNPVPEQKRVGPKISIAEALDGGKTAREGQAGSGKPEEQRGPAPLYPSWWKNRATRRSSDWRAGELRIDSWREQDKTPLFPASATQRRKAGGPASGSPATAASSSGHEVPAPGSSSRSRLPSIAPSAQTGGTRMNPSHPRWCDIALAEDELDAPDQTGCPITELGAEMVDAGDRIAADLVHTSEKIVAENLDAQENHAASSEGVLRLEGAAERGEEWADLDALLEGDDGHDGAASAARGGGEGTSLLSSSSTSLLSSSASSLLSPETWARRTAARQRQIMIGKNRPEWKNLSLNYRSLIPQPPPAEDPTLSKRQFDRLLGEWRRRLHHAHNNAARLSRMSGTEVERDFQAHERQMKLTGRPVDMEVDWE